MAYERALTNPTTGEVVHGAVHLSRMAIFLSFLEDPSYKNRSYNQSFLDEFRAAFAQLFFSSKPFEISYIFGLDPDQLSTLSGLLLLGKRPIQGVINIGSDQTGKKSYEDFMELINNGSIKPRRFTVIDDVPETPDPLTSQPRSEFSFPIIDEVGVGVPIISLNETIITDAEVILPPATNLQSQSTLQTYSEIQEI
jgi:hypothetical protein